MNAGQAMAENDGNEQCQFVDIILIVIIVANIFVSFLDIVR